MIAGAALALWAAVAHADEAASPAPCPHGPLELDSGLLIGHARTLCAGQQLLTSTDGLLVGGAAALGAESQVGVVGLIPIQESWPRVAIATGELGLRRGPRWSTSARAAVGYARLPDRDRSAALLSGGLSASWRPEPVGGRALEALARRSGLHLGVSGWTGAGQPLGTVVELSRGGALVGEAGADLLLAPSLGLSVEAIVPTVIFGDEVSAGRLAVVAYGLRGAGERLRVDVGFLKGTGEAAQLDALRLGFPLLRISGLLRGATAP